jgi:hypothetical protein
MANQDKQNIVETMLDTQKQILDTVVENTKKFTNDNHMVNETIEKGNEWFKKWMETQKTFFTKATDQAEKTTETAKESASKMNEFYEKWFSTEMNWAKQMWDMNQNWLKSFTTANAADSNPFAQWQNNWNNWINQMQNMNTANNWMNQMQNVNPFNMDAWKKTNDSWSAFFNQYQSILNNNFAEWQKNFQNGTTQDAYKNMLNVNEGFVKFAELWMPMWKSISEKTFNMEVYKQWMNPAVYKDMMDKYLGFLPESSRQYFHNMGNMMTDGMKQASQMGMNGYQQMRDMMSNTGWNGSQIFGNVLNGYNTWYNQMNEAFAPFTKMITPNQQTKVIAEWNDILNRMAVYNIKNAEMQYMIYNQGVKVMDQLAENVAKMIQEGKEVNSMLALYQEWLNISDKVYVSLFESDEYSKLMAEVSAMQLKLRKDIENQMEKYMTGIPVATRSEMDEMYKTIYDLKKQVRQLEKMMGEGDESIETEEKTTKRTKKA